MVTDFVQKHLDIIKDSNTAYAILMESIFALMNEGSNDSKHILFDVARNHECELIRHETIFAIGEIGGDCEIRNFLKEILSLDNSVVVQHEALVVLGLVGLDEDVEFMEQYVDHEIPEVSSSAKIGIQRLRQTEDFRTNVKNDQEGSRKRLLDIEHNNEADRIQILFQLMKYDTIENVSAINQCFLTDPCPIVRHEAAFVLGEMKSDESFQALRLGIFKQESSVAIHEALFALGTTGREEALEVIEKFENSDEYIISKSAQIAREKIELVKNPYRGI